MLEISARTGKLQDRHDRCDARPAADAQKSALLLRIEGCLAQGSEPLDEITRPRRGKQPIRECAARFTLDRELDFARRRWMIDHRVRAIAADVRDAQHRK